MVILRLAAHSLASSPKCPILATRQVAWHLKKVTDKTRRYCANMCPVSWSDRGLPASLDRKRALDSAKALYQSVHVCTDIPKGANTQAKEVAQSITSCKLLQSCLEWTSFSISSSGPNISPVL